MLTDYAFCIAVKEMEAWLLGDEDAIYSAYPEAKKKFLKIISRTRLLTHGKCWQIWYIPED